MNELSNIALISGNYNGNELELFSNENIVNIIDKIQLIMSTSKTVWKMGSLEYKIDIINNTNKQYKNSVLTIKLNKTLIDLVDKSVKINEKSTNDYVYDLKNNTLTIKIEEIKALDQLSITYLVKKKRDEFFILKTNSILSLKYYDLLSKINASAPACPCRPCRGAGPRGWSRCRRPAGGSPGRRSAYAEVPRRCCSGCGPDRSCRPCP